MNIRIKRTRPLSWIYAFGLLVSKVGTPANNDLASDLLSAKSNNTAPTRDRFLKKKITPMYCFLYFLVQYVFFCTKSTNTQVFDELSKLHYFFLFYTALSFLKL